jgi:Zn-dependent protease
MTSAVTSARGHLIFITICLCQNGILPHSVVGIVLQKTSIPTQIKAMGNSTWSVGIFVCFGWLFSLCLHEFGHAIVAYWGGDKSVKEMGYLSFNPLRYTNAGLSLIMPLLFLAMGGMALPGGAVYINPSKLRNRWWLSAVSAAGPAANVLVAILLATIIQWIPGQNDTTQYFVGNKFNDLAWLSGDARLLASLALLTYFQVFVTILNLLPIPGLDGFGIIEPWLPRSIQAKSKSWGNYAFLILLGLLWFIPSFSRLISIASYVAIDRLNISIEWVFIGSKVFEQPINKVIVVVMILILAFYLNEDSKSRKS